MFMPDAMLALGQFISDSPLLGSNVGDTGKAWKRLGTCGCHPDEVWNDLLVR